MKVIFDHNTPDGIAAHLHGHEVKLAREMGWDRLVNGVLLATAEAQGFDVLLTCDSNLQYQQNLSNRRIAIIHLTTNHWPSVSPRCAAILREVNAAKPGSYTTVTIPQLPLRNKDRSAR